MYKSNISISLVHFLTLKLFQYPCENRFMYKIQYQPCALFNTISSNILKKPLHVEIQYHNALCTLLTY
jgi:hypothetical protein